MTDARIEPRFARVLLVLALILGASVDALTRNDPWRLGLSVWIVLAVLVALYVFRSAEPAGVSLGRDRALLITAMLLGGAAVALRDAEALYVLAFLGTLAAAVLLAWRSTSGPRTLADLRVLDVLFMPLQAGFGALTGAPFLALRDASSKPESAGSGSGAAAARKNLVPLIVGIIIAVPVTMVVASLLAESDPVFDALAGRFFDMPFASAFEHVVATAFFSWVLAGWLRALVRRLDLQPTEEVLGHLRPSGGFALIAPTLYVLVALLAVFLLVQARALFGGAAYVEMTSGLTYAEYARKGVFGLVAVGILSVGLLVAGDWLQRDSTASDTRRFRAGGWTLLVLVAVLLASAAHRMALYVEYFGLTDTRVYAMAVTTMVGLTMAWCGMTILRGRPERFAIGVLVVAASGAIVLHGINPERIAVRVNGARAQAGEAFDIEYHSSLSADALPDLRRVAAELPGDRCAGLVAKLHEVWTARFAREGDDDWRSWNLPRARARAWLSASLADVSASVCGGASDRR